MSEKKFRQAATAGMLPRQPQPPMTAEELDGPPWEGRYGRDGMPIIPGTGATECGAIRKAREPQPIAAGLKPFHEELSERYERADRRTIGYIPSHNGRERKAGHKPEAAHPWRNPKPGEQPTSFEDRFSQLPSRCVQLVKNGRPLTDRGAELLGRPQSVVVSPAGAPPHSKQTKQVHQYQQTKHL